MALFTKKEEKQETTAAVASANLKLPTILLQPRISEKAGKMAETSGKYVFKVKPNANKIEIKKAVQNAYKVKVVQVNIINTKGKVRTYGRTQGKTQDFKKAIVTLKKGEKIEM